MSWISEKEDNISWFQNFCMHVIKIGPIPKHIAFIMDGNRRYAEKQNMEKSKGHVKGFTKLSETLQWCRRLEITEVTVYAFSIENFKRTQDEVDTIMNLAREKFQELLDDRENLLKTGVCIRIIGNLDLIPADLRTLMAKVIMITKDCNKFFLNIAFAYTSRDEITNAVKTILEGVENDLLNVDDINENLLSECLYTNKMSNPDMLIRTSGEVRFSDFLLWQIPTTHVCFSKVLWPGYTIWHFLSDIFQYQRSYKTLQQVKHSLKEFNTSSVKSDRQKQFLDYVNTERLRQIETFATS